MLKKLQDTNTGFLEFFIKFPVMFFLVMPASMGGCFWVGLQLDSLLNIHLLKMVFPVIGSVLGLYLTGLLVLWGHAREAVVNKAADKTRASAINKTSIPVQTPMTQSGYFHGLSR